jgi:hypothetical protein
MHVCEYRACCSVVGAAQSLPKEATPSTVRATAPEEERPTRSEARRRHSWRVRRHSRAGQALVPEPRHEEPHRLPLSPSRLRPRPWRTRSCKVWMKKQRHACAAGWRCVASRARVPPHRNGNVSHSKTGAYLPSLLPHRAGQQDAHFTLRRHRTTCLSGEAPKLAAKKASAHALDDGQR